MTHHNIFTEEEQRALEQMEAPMAVMQLSDSLISPVLVTDGLCSFFKKDRDSLMEYFKNTMGVQIYDEDYPIILDAYQKALIDPMAPIDMEYRFRTSENDDYFWVHNIAQIRKERMVHI